MSYIYRGNFQKGEREREKFYVINVKYKEISWRVREERGERRGKK